MPIFTYEQKGGCGRHLIEQKTMEERLDRGSVSHEQVKPHRKTPDGDTK